MLKFKLKYLVLIFVFFAAINLFAADIAGGHLGAVTSLIYNKDTVISGGEDGFIGIWSIAEKAAITRFQITTCKITAMVKHPLKDEICVIETGRIGQYRISVWNFAEKKKIFRIQSKEPVTYINYSAAGSFILAGGFDGNDLTIIDSKTGEVLSSYELDDTPALAVTGNSERNMLLYMPGVLSYFNLIIGEVTQSLDAPDRLSNPVVFGNNRFLASTSRNGLVLVDTVTAEVLDSKDNIKPAALIAGGNEEFYCLNNEEGTFVLYTFSVDRRRQLTTRRQIKLSNIVSGADTELLSISAFAFFSNNAAKDSTSAAGVYIGCIATTEGNLFLIDNRGRLLPLAFNKQLLITEIGVTLSSIACLTKDGELFFIPADYRLLDNMKELIKEDAKGYRRISTIKTSAAETSTKKTSAKKSDASVTDEPFILWDNINPANPPHIVYSDYQWELSTSPEGVVSRVETGLSYLTGRFPILSISGRDNDILVLDTGGNVSVFDRASKKRKHSFFSIGVINAVIYNERYLFLCRSVIRNNSPFLFVDYTTGETIPLSLPANAGVMTYIGNSGNIYGAFEAETENGTITGIFGKGNSVTSPIENIFEYTGEDINLSMAESGGNFAVAADGEAVIYANDDVIIFERTNGLTVKLLDHPDFFISLDSEGNIAWHNNKNGKLLAVFNLQDYKKTSPNAVNHEMD